MIYFVFSGALFPEVSSVTCMSCKLTHTEAFISDEFPSTASLSQLGHRNHTGRPQQEGPLECLLLVSFSASQSPTLRCCWLLLLISGRGACRRTVSPFRSALIERSESLLRFSGLVACAPAGHGTLRSAFGLDDEQSTSAGSRTWWDAFRRLGLEK